MIALLIKAPVDRRVELSLKQLERLSRSLAERALGALRRGFEQAGIGRDAVDRLVMTGCVSRMLLVRKLVGDYLGRPIELSVDPEASDWRWRRALRALEEHPYIVLPSPGTALPAAF